MICPFCKCEFNLEDSPIACPACGYEMPDFDDEEEEIYSLIQTEDRRLRILEGCRTPHVSCGSFDECFALMEALDVPF